MRSVLSISLPAEKKKEIEERAKKAEKDYKAGKTKKLISLSSLKK